MTNEKSGLSLIFNGDSPFKDGQLETLDGLPEGGAIPNLLEAPQEFSPGVDKELKSKIQNLKLQNNDITYGNRQFPIVAGFVI